MFGNFLQNFSKTVTIFGITITFSVSGLIEVVVFSVLVYYIIMWFKRTKAWDLLKGIGVLVFCYIIAKFLSLNNIAYLFETFVSSLLLAAIIVFQPELRKGLEQLGNKYFVGRLIKSGPAEGSSGLTEDSVDAIIRALSVLGRNKVGALIVIERTVLLNEYVETGITLDARISTALLEQIFEHNTPLHDGAVIIRNNRIVSATCYLPLSGSIAISKDLGTRHRAGLGISEVSDCITLIASEETGFLSVAVGGELERNVQPERIRELLMGAEEEQKKTKVNILKKWKARTSHEK